MDSTVYKTTTIESQDTVSNTLYPVAVRCDLSTRSAMRGARIEKSQVNDKYMGTYKDTSLGSLILVPRYSVSERAKTARSNIQIGVCAPRQRTVFAPRVVFTGVLRVRHQLRQWTPSNRAQGDQEESTIGTRRFV